MSSQSHLFKVAGIFHFRCLWSQKVLYGILWWWKKLSAPNWYFQYLFYCQFMLFSLKELRDKTTLVVPWLSAHQHSKHPHNVSFSSFFIWSKLVSSGNTHPRKDTAKTFVWQKLSLISTYLIFTGKKKCAENRCMKVLHDFPCCIITLRLCCFTVHLQNHHT